MEKNVRRLEEILEFNKSFVENKEYEKYKATKKPEKKLVILSCMDTRLTELLPKAMNIKNGIVDLLKGTAGIGITVSRESEVTIPKYDGVLSFRTAVESN